MLGQYMRSPVGFGSYGNSEYGFGVMPKRSIRRSFGDIDADIELAKRDVDAASRENSAAVRAATSPDGACLTGPPAFAPLPAVACNPGLGQAMNDAARRLNDANNKLAKLQEQKGNAAEAAAARAAAGEAMLAAQEAKEAEAAAVKAKTENSAAGAAAATAQASRANASGNSASRASQSAAGQSWLQTAPMEQKLALGGGVVLGALMLIIFALKM